ncbi:hypothetical protein FZC76_14630 [Sutcliffiella horikoshii]|uniref:Uncharacterized protein n=1 Tax=Sutcliffiella horikoshii TaxID=79883 RepID=A0A5D4SWK6_9BACI|nr:hypothetical protein [Sutcliffiella horikoshii]TYS67793.1 hypothetical protein FZC76_14630 [Sutcliffiella horikoshii]
MDNHEKFADVPAGETISYEHFIYYLQQGREIEFTYKGQLYFIDNALKGRALWRSHTQLSEYSTGGNHALLESFKINGVSLAALIKSKKLIISTIF